MKVFKCNMEQPVTQLVDTLRYNQEGCGFDYRLCHWNYYIRPHCDTGVVSANNRNIFGGKGRRYLGLTNLNLSCREILGNSYFSNLILRVSNFVLWDTLR